MFKPIEPGCAAVIVRVEKPQLVGNLGKGVTVQRWVERGEVELDIGTSVIFNSNSGWLIEGEDISLYFLDGTVMSGMTFTVVKENELMRIDPDAKPKEVSRGNPIHQTC